MRRAARAGRSPLGARSRRDTARRGARRARRSRAIGANRRRVGHHVTDDLGPPGTPSAASVSAERSSGQKSSVAMRSTPIRLCSSGIDRSPDCAGPPRRARRGRRPAPAARARQASSSCRRRRAPSRDARARSRRAIPGSMRASISSCGRLRDPGGIAGSPQAELVEEDLWRAPGRSADPCAARPRRARARAARPKSGAT